MLSFSLNGTNPIPCHLSAKARAASRSAAASPERTYSLISSMRAFLALRLPWKSFSGLAFLSRSLKNSSQAARKRFQSCSDFLRGTAPISFHCFCRAIRASVVFFHSLLSFKASACSIRESFFSIFSFIESLNWV